MNLHQLVFQTLAVKGLSFDSFWPTTAIGWLTFVVAVGGLIGMIYRHAKTLNALNGLGGRVDAVEQRLSIIDGQNIERDKAFALMVQANAQLIQQIGEAKKSSEQCDSNSEQYFVQIGSKIDEMRRELGSKSELYVGKFAAIETELRIRNQARPLYIEDKQ